MKRTPGRHHFIPPASSEHVLRNGFLGYRDLGIEFGHREATERYD